MTFSRTDPFTIGSTLTPALTPSTQSPLPLTASSTWPPAPPAAQDHLGLHNNQPPATKAPVKPRVGRMKGGQEESAFPFRIIVGGASLCRRSFQRSFPVHNPSLNPAMLCGNEL